MNETISEMLFTDDELNSTAEGYLCDIIFYDGHGDCLKRNVKVILHQILERV